MRINKFIAESGYSSRRKADELISEGQVTINGKMANLGDKVENDDIVKINGKKIGHEKRKAVYLVFNKPVGVICTGDPNARDNIIDAVGYPDRIFHVGRLDVASSGLILLTNDGDIVNKILRSENEKEKEYLVRVDKSLTEHAVSTLRNGIMIQGLKTKPARVKKLTDKTFNIIITEGRNRQIRRMCEALDYEVKALKRIRIMNIRLGMLGVGKSRELTKAELNELQAKMN